MSKHTWEEWWAIYSLTFGPEQIDKFGLLEGEGEILTAAARDLEVQARGFISANQIVVDKFRELRQEEKRSG